MFNPAGEVAGRTGEAMNDTNLRSEAKGIFVGARSFDGEPSEMIDRISATLQSVRDEALAEGRKARVEEAANSGVGLIASERERQVSEEGWSPEHDDTHTEGELAEAAACYAMPTIWREATVNQNTDTSLIEYLLDGLSLQGWSSWFKPSPENRVRELVKAGALIAAEIDRLQRQAAIRAKAEEVK